MKSQPKNKSGAVKKNMNITAHVAEALKGINKKSNWKSKTSKMTKTLTGKTLNSKPNAMTEDDIEKLFGNHLKEKQSIQLATKVSTQVGECYGYGMFQYRDFISSVKFLQVEDTHDKYLSGLPKPYEMETNRIHRVFDEKNIQDLTLQFKKNYLVGKIIGEGAYATVRVAIYKPTQLKIALKIYEKAKIKQIQRKKSVIREIKILQLLNHPNIVRIHDVVETNNHLNIAMEYLSGLSLGTYLKAQPNGKIPEKTCKKIFKQLSNAVAYIHQFNIAHRDIKLQNIILDEGLNPKLIDFGFSTCIDPAQKTKIFCGTPSYMAPEVVQRKQYRGQTADVWALGVLFFVSLTGIFPFKGSTDQQLFKKIGDSDYPKNQLSFSRSANDLIAKMLRVNSQQRIKAHEIGNHIWFNQCRNESNKKRNTDTSHEGRKRVYTINDDQGVQIEKLKLRESSNKLKISEKSGKKVLAQTCKQNLGLYLKMALKSPKNNEITSFRKKTENKQNLKLSYKNQKNLNATLFKQGMKQNDTLHKKEKLLKTQPKVIQLLRAQMKRRHEKSKSNTHRNREQNN